MVTKITFLLFLCLACGKEVSFKNKLEDVSALNSKEQASYQKMGVLTQGNPSQITYQGQSYIVSTFSSKSALDFISSLPSGSKSSVIFTGGINKKEMVIESIKRQ
jgi:hypothetical protein